MQKNVYVHVASGIFSEGADINFLAATVENFRAKINGCV